MKTLTLLLLVVSWSSSVFARQDKHACSYRLAPPRDVTLHGVDLPTTGVNSEERRIIADWVNRQGLTVVDDGQDRMVGMVFDRRDGQLDRGIYVYGRVEGDRFQVESVAQNRKHYNHFKRLAQARDLAPVEYTVGRHVLECDSIKVLGNTQIKIEMKHGLDLDEVMEFIATTKAKPRWEPDRDKNRRMYLLTDYDARGRLMEVAINHDRRCPNQLVTAYLVH